MLFSKKILFLSAVFTCFIAIKPAQAPVSKIVKITKNNFLTEIMQSKIPVVIDIFAEWCQTCKQMKPIFEKLSQEFANVKFATIDVDQESELATALEIQSIPSFIFFYRGKALTGITGQKSYEELKRLILQLPNQPRK